MRKYWIVLADDDIVCLKSARNLLSGEDMQISVVRSGMELLTFMTKNEPDLILLDIMMPQMDGFETYHRLREYEKEQGRREIPVIFLTGENDSEIEQKGLKIGAADFIRKPFSREVMIRRIQNSIANTEKIASLTEETRIDKLTGLFNKVATGQKVTELCVSEQGMLILLDLDNFKLVNDLYGHDMGDLVLKAFADVMRRNCREKDFLGRIGGDEFLAFFVGAVDEKVVFSFVGRLNEQLVEACVRLMGAEFDIPIGVSAGCAVVKEPESYDTLFKLADRALYQEKQNGNHGCFIYETQVQADGTEEFDPAKELNRMMRICSERGKAERAMMAGQDAFIAIYRYIERFARRHQDKLTRLLIALLPDTGIEPDNFADIMTFFGNILQRNLRKNDVITKDKHNCYFILLPELSEKDIPDLIGRIEKEWEQTGYAEQVKLDFAFHTMSFGQKE